MDLLAGLNEAQQRAVEAGDGPVLVLAGPGSGKTRVLTNRIAYLMHEREVPADAILAVTFTNKAAREMKARLALLVGESRAQGVAMGTFHSLCARWLRRDIVHLGRERDFTVYDDDDQQRVMKRVLRDLGLDEKQNPPRAIHSRISSAKNELVSVAEYARHARDRFDRVVSDCYQRYQALLRESNALDFDDLLFDMVALLQQHPDLLAHYQRRYQYILVDEYQDTNRAQYVLIKLLAQQHENLFVVGDNDQSIYAWRGADVRNILSFEHDYPSAQVILLEQNYRSTQAILDVAQAIMDASDERQRARRRNKPVKRIWTRNAQGLPVTLREGYDQDEEARQVADEVARLVEGGQFQYRDCAVMYRTNAQSRALEEALMLRGVPYRIIGGVGFYERKEIKDVLAYLRVLANPHDAVSLGRILNWPARGIGASTEAALVDLAAREQLTLYQAVQRAAEQDGPVGGRARTQLRGFVELLEALRTAGASLDLAELFDLLLERLALRDELLREYGPDEGNDRFNNVMELRVVVDRYTLLERASQLPTFLEEVALVASVDELDRRQADEDSEEGRRGRVTCITLHQAKGLEFPVVFLIGLEEGLLPHSRTLDSQDQVEEERRLFYVGTTRAQQRLYLHYAFRRTSWGRTSIATPSRFLSDVPKELLKTPGRREAAPLEQRNMFAGRTPTRTTRVNPQPPAAPPRPARREEPRTPAQVTFAPGQRVRHSVFGEGVVISARLVEGDEEVTVAFPERGQKRLLASFAKLERI